MFTTWHTRLFLTVSTSLVPMMRWAVVLDCLLLIGSFSNLLINFLVNYCSPSTSHRTPLRSETVQRFTRTLAASPDNPRPTDHTVILRRPAACYRRPSPTPPRRPSPAAACRRVRRRHTGAPPWRATGSGAWVRTRWFVSGTWPRRCCRSQVRASDGHSTPPTWATAIVSPAR